jgi:hypothetical protein
LLLPLRERKENPVAVHYLFLGLFHRLDQILDRQGRLEVVVTYDAMNVALRISARKATKTLLSIAS